MDEKLKQNVALKIEDLKLELADKEAKLSLLKEKAEAQRGTIRGSLYIFEEIPNLEEGISEIKENISLLGRLLDRKIEIDISPGRKIGLVETLSKCKEEMAELGKEIANTKEEIDMISRIQEILK